MDVIQPLHNNTVQTRDACIRRNRSWMRFVAFRVPCPGPPGKYTLSPETLAGHLRPYFGRIPMVFAMKSTLYLSFCTVIA